MSSTYSTAAVTSASTGLENSRSRRCFGSDPELTPIRSGVPSSRARATTSPVFSGPPMLPGLIRTQCAPASSALIASVWLKWMSAITGIGDSVDDRPQRGDVLLARHGDAHDVRAGLGHAPDLVHRGLQVRRLGLRHRLHGDGRAAPHGDAADVDLPGGSHASECIRTPPPPRRFPALRCTKCRVHRTSTRPLAGACEPGSSAPWPRTRAARRHEQFFAMTGAEPGMRIVDIGCGVARPPRPRARPRHHGRRPRPAPGLPRAVRPGRRHRAPALRRRRSSTSPTRRASIEHVPRERRAAFAAELRARRARLVRPDPGALLPDRAARAAARSPTGCRRRSAGPTGAWARRATGRTSPSSAAARSRPCSARPRPSGSARSRSPGSASGPVGAAPPG